MGKTALIVDDSKTARVALQRVLETHDLAVDTAESAEEALAYLIDNLPDVIFMDHQMPGMDGLEAVSTIKSNPATASIPIMMYTAQKGDVYVGQARALGAAGVLPKQIEPVEISRMLATLQIIDRNGINRAATEGEEEVDVVTSGVYPNLDGFDENLRTLIEDLFDQQRAILRRDLLDSREAIAAHVADEIKPPEVDADEEQELPPEKGSRYLLQWVTGAFAVLAVVFAGLYWQSEKDRRTTEDENTRLQQMLAEQQVVKTQSTLQVQRQFADSQQALDTGRAAALDSIEWAANQPASYRFEELPLGESRLSVVTEMSKHLMALDYQGLVRIESHVGDFCMSLTGPDGYARAAEDLPATQCDQIGFDSMQAYELGLRRSVSFATFLSLANETTGGKIRYEVVSLGNSKPILDYPATPAGETASTWNEIAARNHRVEISLGADER